MKFKPKQCNTDIDRKEMKAANRLCRCEQEACTQAEQKLTVMDANKLLWAIALVIIQRTDQPDSQEGRGIHLF